MSYSPDPGSATGVWEQSLITLFEFAPAGPACPGDLDGNNAVDLSDLSTLLAHFGTPSGAMYADGDLDGNGTVDLSDLTLLLANFGSTCP